MRISRIATAFLMVAALLNLVAQAPPDRVRSEAALRQLEQELAATSLRGDWRLWDQVVAPEWTVIDAFGRQQDKPAMLAQLKNLKGSLDSFRVYDVQVRFLKDDVALVTAEAIAVSGAAGEKNKVTCRFMDVFMHREGKWLVVASQLTPVRSASEVAVIH